MGLLTIGSGLACSAALALGLGFVIPVGDTVGSLCDLVAIATGMVFIGLIDSAEPDAGTR